MNETMTAPEVAAIFKVTETTIYYWRKSGKLPSYKKGSRRVFLKEDVEKLQKGQLRLDSEPERIHKLCMKAKDLWKLIKQDLTPEDKVRLFDANSNEQNQICGLKAEIAEMQKLVKKYGKDKEEAKK